MAGDILVIKQGATGDVVRTSTLLHVLDGPVTWLTAGYNKAVLPQMHTSIREIVPMEEAGLLKDRRFELVVSLDDDRAAAELASRSGGEVMGAYLKDGEIRYTAHFAEWFDMSLVSVHGKENADRLKLSNRKTYQELIFNGFGLPFRDTHRYLINEAVRPVDRPRRIGIEARAGARWPTKAWNGYRDLAGTLRKEGQEVIFMEQRDTLIDYMLDIAACSAMITGDTLAMHIALALGIPTVAIFTCTSPWEIHGYGIMEKVISPGLASAFYRNEYVPEAVDAITVNTVLAAFRKMKTASGR